MKSLTHSPAALFSEELLYLLDELNCQYVANNIDAVPTLHENYVKSGIEGYTFKFEDEQYYFHTPQGGKYPFEFEYDGDGIMLQLLDVYGALDKIGHTAVAQEEKSFTQELWENYASHL